MTHGSREQILELEARVVDVVVDVPLNDLWRHNEDEAKTIDLLLQEKNYICLKKKKVECFKPFRYSQFLSVPKVSFSQKMYIHPGEQCYKTF